MKANLQSVRQYAVYPGGSGSEAYHGILLLVLRFDSSNIHSISCIHHHLVHLPNPDVFESVRIPHGAANHLVKTFRDCELPARVERDWKGLFPAFENIPSAREFALHVHPSENDRSDKDVDGTWPGPNLWL